MKKKKEKGFTLVELLAVVVILAIIVLLAVNAFIPLTQKARKNAFITEIETYVKNAEIYYETEKTKDDFDNCKTGTSGNIVCAIDIKDLTGKYVDKSDDNYNGCVYLNMSGSNNIEYKVSMSNGAFKYTGSALNIKEDNVLNDTTQAKCTDFGEFNEESEEYIPVPPKPKDATLLARQSDDSKENYYAYSDKIVEIEFVNHQNHGSETINCNDNTDLKWCVAEENEEKGITSDSIIAWLEPSSIDASKYKLYIGNTKKIYAPQNSYALFSNFKSLESITFNNFNTSETTNMSLMFFGCIKLISLDLRNFDTSNVTLMSSMFSNCKSLTDLNISSFKTSKVTSMSSMFWYCNELTSLELSHFDTSNVTDMSGMFGSCYALSYLNISNFDTSKVTDMGWMFDRCKKLSSLNLNHFDTSKVTDMDMMFRGCVKLTKLDLSHFETSKVTNMREMFSECKNLQELIVSHFDTSNVIDMYRMFDGCKSITSLDVSNFNTSKVTRMHEMFYNCSNLKKLDLSSFDTSKVTAMDRMFSGCDNLEILDIRNFKISASTSVERMFTASYKLTTIYLNDIESRTKLNSIKPNNATFYTK